MMNGCAQIRFFSIGTIELIDGFLDVMAVLTLIQADDDDIDLGQTVSLTGCGDAELDKTETEKAIILNQQQYII